MNKIKVYLWAVLALFLVASCSQDRDFPTEVSGDGTIMLTLHAPSWDADTRAMLSEQEGSLELIGSFRTEGTKKDKVRVFIQQGTELYDLKDVDFSEISEDGRVAKITITIPEGVDQTKPVNIIGYNGANQSRYITVADGKATMSATTISYNKVSDLNAPVVFRLKDVMPTAEALTNREIQFEHIGAYEIVHFTNKSAEAIQSKLGLSYAGGYGQSKSWMYEAGYDRTAGKTIYPVYNIIDGTISWSETRVSGDYTVPFEIAAGTTESVIAWGIPKPETALPALVLRYSDKKWNHFTSAENIPATGGKKMEVGKVYHAYGEWDGTKVTFLDANKQPRPKPYLSVTTAKSQGESITFRALIGYGARRDAWIDYNNNGVKDGTNENAPESSFKDHTVTVQDQKITFHGAFEGLRIAEQKITKVEISSAQTTLVELDVSGNELSAEALNELFKQLPDINHIEKSVLVPKTLKIDGNPGVKDCDASIAIDKGWILDVLIINSEENNYMVFSSHLGTNALYFELDAADEDKAGVWVDLNNNGKKDEGEAIQSFRGRIAKVEPVAQDIVFYGKITRLSLSEGGCFAFYGGPNPDLKHLSLKNAGLVATFLKGSPNIEYLDLSGNSLYVDIAPLDVTPLVNLKALNLEGCGAHNINLTKNAALTYLNVGGNKLKALDVAIMPQLQQLFAGNNELTTLDISKNPDLIHLELANNKLPVEVLNRLITNLPDRTGMSAGVFYLANNPGTGTAQLTVAKGKNWEIDARNSKADNNIKRPIMIGEDW